MAERITGHTELIGLMAYPIRHSSSPAMHNEAFAYLGLDYAYLAFEVDNSTLEDAVKGIRALKMVGSNVSMPNKTVVGQYLDKLSPAAELCGAVNTIVNENGVLTGHITEGMSVVPDKSFIRPELIVVDVPYSPLETTMRKMAKEVGCKTMNGLGMMLFQGAAAFKLWTGKDMPIEHMKEVLNIKYE